jgi:hypothetical protein
VAEKAIFTGKEVSFLRELHKQGVDYMIVGAAAAALQGAPIVTQDIDLWFRDLADPALGRAVAKVGGVIVPSVGRPKDVLTLPVLRDALATIKKKNASKIRRAKKAV